MIPPRRRFHGRPTWAAFHPCQRLEPAVPSARPRPGIYHHHCHQTTDVDAKSLAQLQFTICTVVYTYHNVWLVMALILPNSLTTANVNASTLAIVVSPAS